MSKRWLAAFAAALLLSFGALSQPASATLILGGVSGTVTSTGGGTTFSTPLDVNGSASGTGGSQNSGYGSFSYSMSSQQDPLINWTFSASGITPSTGTSYDVLFTLPISVSGPFDIIGKTNGLVVSDAPLGVGINPTTANSIDIKGELNGSNVAGVEQSDSTGLTAFGDTKSESYPTKIVDLTGGPYTSMAVELIFTLTDVDGDGTASFNGQLQIEPSVVPEPATVTSAIVGLPLLGFGLWLRRRKK